MTAALTVRVQTCWSRTEREQKCRTKWTSKWYSDWLNGGIWAQARWQFPQIFTASTQNRMLCIYKAMSFYYLSPEDVRLLYRVRVPQQNVNCQHQLNVRFWYFETLFFLVPHILHSNNMRRIGLRHGCHVTIANCLQNSATTTKS